MKEMRAPLTHGCPLQSLTIPNDEHCPSARENTSLELAYHH